MVNVVQEGVVNAKAAAQAAGDALSDNLDDLKDAACEYVFERDTSTFILIRLAETLKSGQKVADNVKTAAEKTFEEAKKTGEELKKKASGSMDDL